MAGTFADQLTKKVDEACTAAENGQDGTAIKLFEQIIKEQAPDPDDLTEEAVKAKETSTYRLANIYKEKGLVDELINLQKSILPLFIDFPKSKTAKIMRTLFDLTLKLEGHFQQLIDLAKYIIEWCE